MSYGKHTLVLGGSMAGLLAAHVPVEFFERMFLVVGSQLRFEVKRLLRLTRRDLHAIA